MQRTSHDPVLVAAPFNQERTATRRPNATQSDTVPVAGGRNEEGVEWILSRSVEVPASAYFEVPF
jgi:hypothetical protein